MFICSKSLFEGVIPSPHDCKIYIIKLYFRGWEKKIIQYYKIIVKLLVALVHALCFPFRANDNYCR